MKTIEREGKSTSAIISGFMKEQNLQLEDFKFEVIEEEKKGLLGIFSHKPTRIRFILPDSVDGIKDMAETFLRKMAIEFEDVQVSVENEEYQLEIRGVKEAGFIIGKEARILDAYQHLLTQMASKAVRKQLKLEVDVDGYRQRKDSQLRDKLAAIAERIKKTGKSYTFEPMLAARRKLIHQFVENDQKLQTMTIGKGENKRVVVTIASKKPQFRPVSKNIASPEKRVEKAL